MIKVSLILEVPEGSPLLMSVLSTEQGIASVVWSHKENLLGQEWGDQGDVGTGLQWHVRITVPHSTTIPQSH